MNKFEERTERKKNAIVAAAMQLFREKGFVDVSIHEIAALASVSQVSIYNYFGSKEALAGECAKVIVKDTLVLAEDILAKADPFEAKLRQAFELCSSQMNQAISSYFSEQVSKDGQLMALLIKSINEMKLELYRKYIEAGKAEGEIPQTLQTESILYVMDCINQGRGSLTAVDMGRLQKDIEYLLMYGFIGRDAGETCI